METERIQYIDRLKGFAMLLVVMGHIYFFLYGRSESICYKLISSFHMPLFMFLSGYVAYKKKNHYSCLYLVKKVWMFMMPMFVFGLCFTYSYSCVHSIDDFGALISAFMLAPAKNGYWYLVSLSVYYISLQCFHLNKSNNFIGDVIVAIVIYCIFLIGWKTSVYLGNLLCLLNCTDFYPFFILGYFVRKYEWIEFVKKHNIIYTIAVIGYLLLFNRDWGIHTVNTISERFVVRLCAIIVVVMIFVWRENEYSYIEKKLVFIGKNTLDVYLLHYFIVSNVNLAFVDRWFENTNNCVLSIAFTLLLAIPITLISIGIGKILHRSAFIEKYIYGKIK